MNGILSVARYERTEDMRYKTALVILMSTAFGAVLYHIVYTHFAPNLTSKDIFLAQERNVPTSSLNINYNIDVMTDDDANSQPAQRGGVSANVRKSRDLHVSKPFHFPQPHFSKPDSVLLHSSWITDLKNLLSSVKGKQISVVTSSIEHTDVLINWLIAAHLIADPPLENIICLTLDKGLRNLLNDRGFLSLHVSPEMVIDPAANVKRVFSQVHIVRLAVVRLLNNYGFDVVNYDCDAITLKNPQIIFDSHKDADLIGTFGKGPNYLFKKWGVTLNTGVMLLRANSRIEHYWETMSYMKDSITDDQGNINKALNALRVKWTLKPTQNIDDLQSEVYGIIRSKLFTMTVMLMPFTTVCRQTCTPEKKDDYFVWHAVAIKENRTVENKMKQAKVGSAWFLSEQWLTISETYEHLQGVQWLQKVADVSSLNQRKYKLKPM